MVSGQCDIHSPPLNIITVHSLPRCQGKGKDNSFMCLSPGSYSGYLTRVQPCDRPEDKEMWNLWELGRGRKDMGDKKEKKRERTDYQTYIAETPLSASLSTGSHAPSLQMSPSLVHQQWLSNFLTETHSYRHFILWPK